MAKRSRTRRARSGGFFRSFRRSSRSNGGEKIENVLIPAAVYGIARPYIANLVSPLTSMVNIGGFSDELAMGLIGYMMAKKGSGMVKTAGKAIMTVEAASIGFQAVNQTQTTGSSGTVWSW